MSYKQKYKVPKVQKKRGKKHSYTIRKENNYTPLIYDMTLQRTIGNIEVQRMFKTGEILAKLFVNQPGDIYEQEADRVAEQIVNMGDKEIQLKSTEIKIQRKGSPGGENISSQLETTINTLKGKGRPLEPKIRDYLQPRFGVNLKDVRIHTDSNADRLARAIRARAFTHGNDVVFAKGTYNPAGKEGKKLIAHELTHVIQQKHQNKDISTVSFNHSIQRAVGDQYGQATASVSRHLICDLTSPITVGSIPCYEIRQHFPELMSADAVVTYRWRKYDFISNIYYFDKTTTTPEIKIPANTPGNYQIIAEIIINGKVSTTLTLYQSLIAEDPFLTSSLSTTSNRAASTYRELVNDFRSYIIDASNATGPMGITPRFLSAVLFIEVLNRPKEGREEEIRTVGKNLRNLEMNGWLLPWDVVNRSIGVGQVRLSTAAMVLGYTPWIDQERDNRGPDRERTEDNFNNLSIKKKQEIYQLLRWPKSNIKIAADLLAKLKNRSNRYPGLSRTDFATNQRAVSIVASEYNLGPTDSTEAEAGPSAYGSGVWYYMTSDPIITHFFPNN